MCIVHGYPCAEALFQTEYSGWSHHIERHEERGDAPVVGILARGAVGGVQRATRRIHDLIARVPIRERVARPTLVGHLLSVQAAPVQKTCMRGIDVAFER